MFILPALWFTILTALLWRKHQGIDTCVYICGLYAAVNVMAVIIVLTDLMGDGGILFGNDDAEFGVIPTLLYCIMLTVSLLPFHLVYEKDIKTISAVSPFLLDCLSALLLSVALLNFYLVADSTLDILSGDLAAIRNSIYAGEDTPAQLKAETLPYFAKILYYFNHATLLALPILFFNLCFRKCPWWWNILLFFTSLSIPVAGIQAADRTEMIYYAEMLMFTLIFFRKHFTRKIKIGIGIVGLPFVLLGAVYVTAVSQSRFENLNEGTSGRNLQYAGQGYLNFCYFWEYANYEEPAVERVFPMYSHFVKKIDSNSTRRGERAGQQGFFISVFPSFIGDVMLDLTPLGMVVWVICYTLIGLLFIRQSHRKEFDISEVLLFFLMACIPTFGIFYYRFHAFTYTFAIILALVYHLLSKYRVRL